MGVTIPYIPDPGHDAKITAEVTERFPAHVVNNLYSCERSCFYTKLDDTKWYQCHNAHFQIGYLRLRIYNMIITIHCHCPFNN